NKYKAQITLTATSSQGDLMWYYQNSRGVFNSGTFDFVSARVSKGKLPYTADLSPGGGFPNAYSWVISSLYFNLSSRDKLLLNNVTTATQLDATKLINTYETTFGTITDEELDEAHTQYGDWVTDKLSFIIEVIAGGRWS